ncbi:MAG: hypothetical protein RLZZ210_148 [Pseudomonadota bacterium]|jgi:HTH-type transcriptional regulator/antitoxin HigA
MDENSLSIKVPHNENEYDKLIIILNNLLDIVGDNENHPLADLLELTGQLAEDFESKNIKIDASNPVDALKFLMDSNQINQIELSKELGITQPVISRILSGERKINLNQAKAFSNRFNVGLEVFID